VSHPPPPPPPPHGKPAASGPRPSSTQDPLPRRLRRAGARVLDQLAEDWTTRPDRRYLMSALAISLFAHLILFALHFTAPRPTRPERDDGLEVVLLNAGTGHAPAQAQLRAQVASDGGGDAASGHAKAPVPHAAASRDGKLLAELQQRQAALEAEQRRLTASLSRDHGQAPTPPGPLGAPAAERNPTQVRAEQLARQFAEISQRVDDYNKRPRRHFFAPSTSEYRFAVYVEQWRQRVETLGNQNYPAAARGKVYGSLRMTVYIRSDGTVERMDIDKPSEHKILNDAARRIVALATPFAPFPPQVARDTDVLAITRTWYFTNDKLLAKPG